MADERPLIPQPCDILTVEDWHAFVSAFEQCTLPKTAWTHQAHLTVGLWFVRQHPADEALDLLRRHIRRYNEAAGTANTESSGYHETLTRLFAEAIRRKLEQGSCNGNPIAILQDLLMSELSDKKWPLRFYSRARLMSLEARQRWVEPDLPTPA